MTENTDERQQLALAAPTAEHLAGFPVSTIQTTKKFYRAHRTAHGAWFFSHDGSGRFDLPEPGGTCYLAESKTAALRETLGTRLVASGTVDRPELALRQISLLHVPETTKVANTTSAEAANHGATREFWTVTPYRNTTQVWAAAWHQHGLGGVRYMGRFSTAIGTQARCLAVFGAAGPGDGRYLEDPAPTSASVTASAAGINITDPPPTTAALTIVTPPPSGVAIDPVS